MFKKIAENQMSGNFSNGFGKSESLSGPGSELKQTDQIIKELPCIFKKYNIKCFFDVPCGDFFWMKNVVNNCNTKYIGGDIVDKIVTINKKNNKDIEFIKFNICNDKIPDDVDLIFIRDLFVHFSYENIKKSIENIKKSNVKYIMMTTFINRVNTELPTKWPWRPLCFFNQPFNFPKPKELINELCSEDFPNNLDKSLGLWYVKDINLLF